jgi:rhamnosyl/mannosyltransferase
MVARHKGPSRIYQLDGVFVEAVASFGTLFSTPLAPTFPLALLNRAANCDIVVHHAPFPLADVAVYRLPAHVGLIVYWHADIVGFPLLKKLVTPAIRATLRRADRIIIADQSNIDSAELIREFAGKCAIIPYGADVGSWSTCTAEEAEAAADLRKRHPRMILAIGRLVPYKGFAVLLQALARIDGHLVLVGEGPLEPELRSLAGDLGISNRVTFTGRLAASEMKPQFHAARVLALPSVTTAEAFGIVQIEAMAAGLPVVNTGLPTAVPQIARHEHEGLTVPPSDVAALAAALGRILDDPMLAERLGRAGQFRAQSEYSEQVYMSRIRTVYEDVLRLRAGVARS